MGQSAQVIQIITFKLGREGELKSKLNFNRQLILSSSLSQGNACISRREVNTKKWKLSRRWQC